MFSSQVYSALRSQHKLSSCRWSTSGRSLTGDRGSISFDEPSQSPSQTLLDRRAHPTRYLICAIISSLLFFVTGSIAIFYAIKSINCERHGHYEQAFIHSRRSLAWSMATFVLALFIYLTIGLILFIRTVDHRG